MSGRRFLPVLALLACAPACGDGGQPPSGAGDLLVAYSSGSPNAGAMVLTITGGVVENVTPVGSLQVSFSKPYPSTTRIVVIGALTTGDVLRIRVPDVSQATSYAVRADQVADNTTFALINPAQHTFTVHR